MIGAFPCWLFVSRLRGQSTHLPSFVRARTTKNIKRKKSPNPLWGHIQQKTNPKSRLLNKYWANVFISDSGLAYCGCLALLKEKGSILSLKYAIHAFLWNSWYQISEKCECELKVVSNICIVLWTRCRRARAQIEYRRWSYSDSHRSD